MIVGAWQRTHPLTLVFLLLRSFAVVGSLVVVLAGQVVLGALSAGLSVAEALARVGESTQVQWLDAVLAFASESLGLWGLVGCGLLVVGLGVVVTVFSWLRLEYRVTAEAVELRSGVLFRQQRRARLDQVQGVSVHRPLVARGLGLSMLRVSTAGDSVVQLRFLAAADAVALRADLLLRAVAAGSSLVDAGVAEPMGAGGQQPGVRAAGDDGILVGDVGAPADGAALGRTGAAGGGAVPVFAHAVPSGRLVASAVLDLGVLLSVLLVVQQIVFELFGAAAPLIVVLVVVAPRLFGALKSLERQLLCRVELVAQTVMLRRGWLNTATETIPLHRIHAVELRQHTLWRPFGWWQIRVTLAGELAEESEQHAVLLPVAPAPVALALLRVIVPVVAPHEGVVAALLRDRVIARVPGMEGVPPRAWPLLPGARARHGFFCGGAVLVVGRGLLFRRVHVVQVPRVQSCAVSQGLLQRWLRLGSLSVHLVDRTTVRIRGCDVARAGTLFLALTAQVTEAIARGDASGRVSDDGSVA